MTTSTLVECQRLFIAYRDVRTYGHIDSNYLKVLCKCNSTLSNYDLENDPTV